MQDNIKLPIYLGDFSDIAFKNSSSSMLFSLWLMFCCAIVSLSQKKTWHERMTRAS